MLIVQAQSFGQIGAVKQRLSMPVSREGASAQIVHPPESKPYGISLGEWGAIWWQWVFSIPVSTNPLSGSGSVDCSYKQSNHEHSEHVWFLAGSFIGPVSRTCNVPSGVSLLFPLINVEWDNVGFPYPNPPTSLTVQQLAQNAAQTADNPVELHASIDGTSVGDTNTLLKYRARYAPFQYTMPAIGNLYNTPAPPIGLAVPGVDWPYTNGNGDPVVYPTASDGYYLFLEPLSVGKHVINFGGTFNGSAPCSQCIQYTINVVPNGQY
jgi:hypothetical protein